MRTFLIAFSLSLILSLILTPLIRNWALRLNLYDSPSGGRKIHKAPIPRLGGIAIMLSMSVPLLGLSIWDNEISQQFLSDIPLLKSLIGGSLIIAAVGIVDDIFGMRAWLKLSAQILAALVVYFSGIQIEAISIPFFSPLLLHWASLPATVFWVVLVINAINLIDGLDGLAGSVVALAAFSLFVMGLIEDSGVSCLLLITLLGGVVGFLRYNFNPASIFLGDTGSMLLGFILSLSAIHFSQKSFTLFSMLSAFLVLGLPIFDLGLAVVRRFLSGQPIFRGDQHHIHHILLRRGLSQKQSMLLLLVVAVGLESLAFMSIYAEDRLAAMSIVVLIPIAALATRFLGYEKLVMSARQSKLLKQTKIEASIRLQSVRDFGEELSGCANWEESTTYLQGLCTSLGWHKVRICDENGELWSHPERMQDIHLQDHRRRSIGLPRGMNIEIEILHESEVFSPLDEALQDIAVGFLSTWLKEHCQDRFPLSVGG
jgi:UDP-GlcNAc:undecaprenyl-phosphate/decaprenyl-phosphate GlcNAc-1-phosphate transferase